jgi:hypothetical protein
MAKKAPFVRPVFILLLTLAIVFALYKWYEGQQEGFQGADQTFNIIAKWSNANANMTVQPTPGFNATVTGGRNRIEFTNIPATLGKLKDVKIFHVPSNRTTFPVVSSTQAVAATLPAGVTKFDRGATDVVLETINGSQIRTSTFAATRQADFNALAPANKLPQTLSSFRLRNFGTSAFGTINTAANVNSNIRIALTFGP